VARGTRQYIQREGRLVTEWVTATFPQAHVAYRIRLGAIDASLADTHLTERQLRGLGVFRRYVDAVVLTRDVVHLVEGKILNRPGALEQLDIYARLFPLTPGYEAYRTLPVAKHLVWSIWDPVVEAMARERGINVHLFHPPWVDEYLKTLTPRAQTSTPPGGLFDDPPPTTKGYGGGKP